MARKDVDRVDSDRRHHTISLRRGRWPRMVVACSADNHAAVEAYARGAIEAARRPSRR